MIRWAKVNKLLEGSDERTKKYKKELFGSTTIEEYPDQYNYITVLKKAGNWSELHKFKELPIHTRAQLMAHTYLENIVEVLQRHDSLQDQKIKEMERKVSSRNA